MIENNERLIDLLAGGSLYSTYAKEKAEKAAEKAAKIAESTSGKTEVDGDFQMTQSSGGTGRRHDGKSYNKSNERGGRSSKRGGAGRGGAD